MMTRKEERDQKEKRGKRCQRRRRRRDEISKKTEVCCRCPFNGRRRENKDIRAGEKDINTGGEFDNYTETKRAGR